MAIKDETVAGSAIGLRRDAIGLREVLYMIYLYRRHPGRVTDVGLVHLDGEV